MSLLRGDLGEEEHYFRHRLLPAGEDLGVADGNAERQSRRGQFDVADEVYGTHWVS